MRSGRFVLVVSTECAVDRSESSLSSIRDKATALVYRLHEDAHAANEIIQRDAAGSIRDDAQDDRPGETSDGADEANAPLGAAEPGDAEGGTADEDDHDLAADHNAVDSQEPVVAEHALEDIELVV